MRQLPGMASPVDVSVASCVQGVGSSVLLIVSTGELLV